MGASNQLKVALSNDTVKVRVTMTVEVDRRSWRKNYGDDNIADIRGAVKQDAAAVVQYDLDNRGVAAVVAL